nr:ATP synthase subunit-like protein [Ipomoea batatas]
MNIALAKKKTRGEEIYILFPPPYHKFCGKDASLFKAEVTMCIRQFTPLRIYSWKEIPNKDVNIMWIFLKVKLKLYLKCKDFPHDVNEDDWTWLIENKWETQKFKNKLQEEGEKNKEKISAAPLPLVEHFDLVLKRKSSYARGLGLKRITSKTQDNILLQVEI